VGMGGRFDATNVLPASLEIITKIGLEHTKFLGKTYHEIAGEKAGIIKPGSTVISTTQKEDAMQVIKDKAKGKKAKIYIYKEHFKVRRTAVSVSGQEFSFYSGKERFLSLKTPLLGIHQMENMALVVQSVRLLGRIGFPLNQDVLYKGMATVVWPCRFQVIKENPAVVIDGAHNPDGILTLYKTLRDVFPGQEFSFLTGILKDKDWGRMLKMLLKNSKVDEMVFARPDTNRAVDPEILAGFVKSKRNIKTTVIPEVSAALKYVFKTEKNWCICGSLYLCGDVLSLIQK